MSVRNIQMAAMLLRYMEYKGYTFEAVVDASVFDDDAEINEWAKSAVTLMQTLGIINGKPGNIYDPQGLATRGEIAAIFTRFIKAYNNIDDLFEAIYCK